MKIINVVGARPNFIKIAPLVEEMKKFPHIEQLLVHTEQHYDKNMSKLFFEDLGIPAPDISLGVGSASHATQTAKIMMEFEKVLLKEKPDLTLVVGDVNSTIACALTSVKLNIPVAHVEAGLRSFDRTMPEEINRILTDAISDYLFITERDAEINLLKEGIDKNKIFFVGNVMIDTLLKNMEKANKSNVLPSLGLTKSGYAVLTLHRPSNVDNVKVFTQILEALEEIKKKIRIVYPVHPRTKKMIDEFSLDKNFAFLKPHRNIGDKNDFIMIDALGYLDFLHLTANAKFVLTDSGGIQEETTILKIPCITLRDNTERLITVTQGTNVITGTNTQNIINGAKDIILGKAKKNNVPEFWDGKAAKRIVEILLMKDLKKNE